MYNYIKEFNLKSKNQNMQHYLKAKNLQLLGGFQIFIKNKLLLQFF